MPSHTSMASKRKRGRPYAIKLTPRQTTSLLKMVAHGVTVSYLASLLRVDWHTAKSVIQRLKGGAH